MKKRFSVFLFSILLSIGVIQDTNVLNATSGNEMKAPYQNYTSETESKFYSGGELTGKSGTDLLESLTKLMFSKHRYYTSYNDVRGANAYSDADPDVDGNVLTIYSSASVTNAWNGGGLWNREHVWCKNRTNSLYTGLTLEGTSRGAGADIHQLKPSIKSVNSTRGDKKYADLGGNPSTKMYYNDKYIDCGYTGDTFEPRDAVKGDIARILMYMYAHYSKEAYDATGEYSVTQSGSTYQGDLYIYNIIHTSQGTSQAAWDLLLNWNRLDPVDEFERTRNEYCTSITGVRNPFVDHPEFAEMIWDTSYTGSGALTDTSITYTLPNTLELSEYTHPLNIGDTYQITATPTGTGSLSYIAGDTSVVSVSDTGLVTAIDEGISAVSVKYGTSYRSIKFTVGNPDTSISYTNFDFTNVTGGGSGYQIDHTYANNDKNFIASASQYSQSVFYLGVNDKNAANAFPLSSTWDSETTLINTTLKKNLALSSTAGHAYFLKNSDDFTFDNVAKIKLNWQGANAAGTVYVVPKVNGSYKTTSGYYKTASVESGTDVKGSLELSFPTDVNIEGLCIIYVPSGTNKTLRLTTLKIGCRTETLQSETALINSTMSLGYEYTKVDHTSIGTDELSKSILGISGTSYVSKTKVLKATYSAYCAGGNNSIQLRTSDSTSGIVSTKSGGFLKKVVVSWNESTAAGRSIEIYGSNTKYSSTTELYDDNKKGTLLGSISKGETTLTIEGSYTYVGIKSANNALYLPTISIDWEYPSSTTYKNVNFKFRCAVDASIKDLADKYTADEFGIKITASNGKSNTYVYGTYTMFEEADGLLYVTINLGDVINNIERCDVVFTVCAYTIKNGETYYGVSTPYSVASIISYYNTTYKSDSNIINQLSNITEILNGRS